MSETTIPLQEIHAPITPPEKYTPDAYERTAEGYLGLAVELRETQRALSQDFRVLMAGSRPELQRLASPYIGARNRARGSRPGCRLYWRAVWRCPGGQGGRGRRSRAWPLRQPEPPAGPGRHPRPPAVGLILRLCRCRPLHQRLAEFLPGVAAGRWRCRDAGSRFRPRQRPAFRALLLCRQPAADRAGAGADERVPREMTGA